MRTIALGKALAVFALILLNGCTEHVAYRPGAKAVERAPATRASCPGFDTPSGRDVPIGYVEIDEQGSFFDRRTPAAGKRHEGQVEHVLELVRQTPEPKYVVVFVHGWFHSAKTDDTNVRDFRCALDILQGLQGKQGERVIGIYVGWRGESLSVPGLRFTTFWDRKNTSEEIGRGSLVEFLMRLEGAVKPAPTSPNKLMLVGHSFGASVVFNSIGQIMLARFILDAEKLLAEAPVPTHAQSKPGLISAYGDLVVLVNPAIEATRIWPFFSTLNYYTGRALNDDTRQKRDLLADAQPPRLVVLSSQGDAATRRAFPAARLFSTLFESYKDPNEATPYGQPLPLNQRRMDRQTMGNIDALQTHAPLRASDKWTGACPSAPAQWLPRAVERRRDEQVRAGQPPTGAGWAQKFDGRGIEIRHLGITSPSNPLWVMAVGKELIENHSDIADPSMICLFDQLLGDPEQVREKVQEERERAPKR